MGMYSLAGEALTNTTGSEAASDVNYLDYHTEALFNNFLQHFGSHNDPYLQM